MGNLVNILLIGRTASLCSQMEQHPIVRTCLELHSNNDLETACNTIGLCLFIVDASADCIADLQNNGKILGCMQNLMPGFQSLDQNDPRSMCTDDMKKNMGCLTDFLKQCPEISSPTGPFASVLPIVEQFKTLCGTPAAQKCPGLSACRETAGLLAEQAEMTPSGNSTPFSLIPMMVYSVCRVGKAQLKCLNDHRDACPDVVKEAEGYMSNAMAIDNTSNVNYDMMKTFINVDCQAIPTDFPSNECVREKLEGSGFLYCIMRVKQLSSKAAEKEQCKFYFDGKACIEEYIGKPCGSKFAQVIVDTAHWVIHDIPKNCDMFLPPPQEKDNDATETPVPENHDPTETTVPENGSSSIRVTLATFMMLIFAVIV